MLCRPRKVRLLAPQYIYLLILVVATLKLKYGTSLQTVTPNDTQLHYESAYNKAKSEQAEESSQRKRSQIRLPLPTTFDLRDQNFVTSVKFQGMPNNGAYRIAILILLALPDA